LRGPEISDSQENLKKKGKEDDRLLKKEFIPITVEKKAWKISSENCYPFPQDKSASLDYLFRKFSLSRDLTLTRSRGKSYSLNAERPQILMQHEELEKQEKQEKEEKGEKEEKEEQQEKNEEQEELEKEEKKFE